MQRYKWSKMVCGCLFGILGFCTGRLWAALDMYVYNVGQANCILVTVDNADQRQHPGKSTIFFDTGAQNKEQFNQSQVRMHITKQLENVIDVWFVLSHTDNDHVNVFSDIAEICNEIRRNRIESEVEARGIAPFINGVIVGTVDILNYASDNFSINHLAGREPPGASKIGWEELKGVSTTLNNIAGISSSKALLSVLSGVQYYKCEYDQEGQHNHSWVKNDDDIFQRIVNAINGVNSQLKIEFLRPFSDSRFGTDANDASLVAKLIYARNSILLPGDAPGKLFGSIVKNLNNRDQLKNIDIFICPHHGSMSENSYRWRGELNHPEMFSIASNNPGIGKDKIPEKSFVNCLLEGVITLHPHEVAWWSQLAQKVQFLKATTAPLLVTCCAGESLGIGYHVRIDTDGNIGIFDICSSERNGERELQIFPPIQSEGRGRQRQAEAGRGRQRQAEADFLSQVSPPLLIRLGLNPNKTFFYRRGNRQLEGRVPFNTSRAT